VQGDFPPFSGPKAPSGAPQTGDTFGDSSNDWPRQDATGGGGFGTDTFGSDTFGDTSGFSGFGDFGAGGSYDAYGYSNYVDTSACGCFPKKEEQTDMAMLARHLYDLLLREAYVERERLGIA